MILGASVKVGGVGLEGLGHAVRLVMVIPGPLGAISILVPAGVFGLDCARPTRLGPRVFLHSNGDIVLAVPLWA